MPATMKDWKEPMLDITPDPTQVEGEPSSFVQADQQGTSIGKPSVRLDFDFTEDFIQNPPANKHDGGFIKEVANSKVTDGMKKAGY